MSTAGLGSDLQATPRQAMEGVPHTVQQSLMDFAILMQTVRVILFADGAR